MKNILCLALILLMCMNGCGSKKDGGAKKAIAIVNGEKVYDRDLTRAIELYSKSNPFFKVTPHIVDDQLNTVIDRKLLIQEAKKKKLDRDEKFLDTIKSFWAETLIKNFMETKEKEFISMADATDSEITKYYEKLSYRIKFDVVRSKSKETIEKLFSQKPDTIKWDEEMGPVSYEDISSDVISGAFNLNAGEEDVFKDKNYYYLVYVKQKNKIEVQPLSEIRDAITQKIKMAKMRELMREWMDKMKTGSKINILQDTLEELKCGYNR
jgi:hypothetical protein